MEQYYKSVNNKILFSSAFYRSKRVVLVIEMLTLLKLNDALKHLYM